MVSGCIFKRKTIINCAFVDSDFRLDTLIYIHCMLAFPLCTLCSHARNLFDCFLAANVVKLYKYAKFSMTFFIANLKKNEMKREADGLCFSSYISSFSFTVKLNGSPVATKKAKTLKIRIKRPRKVCSRLFLIL